MSNVDNDMLDKIIEICREKGCDDDFIQWIVGNAFIIVEIVEAYGIEALRNCENQDVIFKFLKGASSSALKNKAKEIASQYPKDTKTLNLFSLGVLFTTWSKY